MDDLYEAIGTIAACAHANGDQIDKNIRPEDNQNITHGLDIYRRSRPSASGLDPEAVHTHYSRFAELR